VDDTYYPTVISALMQFSITDILCLLWRFVWGSKQCTETVLFQQFYPE